MRDRNSVVRGQANARCRVLRPDGIELKPETRLIPPRHQRRARGGAKSRCHIAACETRTTRRERVDVRSANFFTAVAAQFAITKIIGYYDDDIRLRCIFPAGVEYSATNGRKLFPKALCSGLRQKSYVPWNSGESHYTNLFLSL